MPYLASAPYMEASGSSKMPPTAVPWPYAALSAYPAVNAHEPASVSSEATTCATPHHTSSPQRYNNGGVGGGRAGCYVSHSSAASFFNGNGGLGGSGGYGTGTSASHPTSFFSNELQEYMSMASPSNDFYYYSPQPCYFESPMPCAAAELYGSSLNTASFASNLAASPGPGTYCYNAESVNAISSGGIGGGGVGGGAPTTPSLMSSMSISGSRFPQWYLPRGMYGSSMAVAAAAAAAATPVSTFTPLQAAEEDVMSGAENVAAVAGQRHAQPLPAPPRMTPQSNPSPVGPLTLPPSVMGVERDAPAAAGYRTSPHPGCGPVPILSVEASPTTSPTFRPGRPPQFVPYDGRAYGLPLYRGLSSTEATVAIARSPLATDAAARTPATTYRSPGVVQAAAGNAGRRDAQRHTHSPAVTPAAAPKQKDTQATATRLASANTVHEEEEGKRSEGEEEVYSPKEKALLADAHTRLAKLRAKAHEEQQKARATASSAEGHQARLGDSVYSVGEEGDIPVSPIPRLCESEDAATARLDDSMMEELEMSEQQQRQQQQHATADADVDTRAVLEQVLSVRGVKWRHDPYSRRVLVHSAGPSSAEDEVETGEAEEGERCERHRRHAPPSSASEPSSPDSRRAKADGTGPKRHSSNASAATGVPNSTNTNSNKNSSTLTQPHESITASLNESTQTQASADDSAERSRRQPSARRMPIKKVCVRHFHSGNGEAAASVDSTVGVLASVVTHVSASELARLRRTATTITTTTTAAAAAAAAVLPTSLSCPTAQEASAVKAATSHSSTTTDLSSTASGHQEWSTTVSPPARPPPQEEKCHHRSSGGQLVPPPRSKQLHRDANQGVEQRMSAPASAMSSASSTTARLPSSAETSGASTNVLRRNPDGMTPLLAAAAPTQRTAPYSSFAVTSSAVMAETWAWRARLPQLLALQANSTTAAARTGDASCWGGEKFSSTADIDTRLLVRLWQKLDSSGCFRDVLEARQRKLGAESNSSARVVGRSVARRFGARPAVDVGDDGNRPNRLRQAMLREAEVTHVYVLRHRYRTSCAVAARRYECGTEVVVDGDMGVDTGVVLLVMTKAEYHALSAHERRAAEVAQQLEFALPASIHRAVSAEEVEMRSAVQVPLEDATLEFLRFLARHPHLFSSCRIEYMEFVSVEFQADAQKLYVYYQASSAVRFLELATYLNHVFHCRIWMKLAKSN